MKEPKKMMDIILVILAVFLLIFTVTMLVMYYIKDGIPDTLCTCVFAICGGECGVMGWIKTTKERYRDRQFELEDRQEEKKNPNREKEEIIL